MTFYLSNGNFKVQLCLSTLGSSNLSKPTKLQALIKHDFRFQVTCYGIHFYQATINPRTKSTMGLVYGVSR